MMASNGSNVTNVNNNEITSRLGENCCVGLCLYGGLLALRTKLRIKYKVQGSICNDFCVLCWCNLCATCQMSRELDYVGI
ncbi:hypothetical protein LSH36_337g05070 [Paralvinella palmiformis]|uniref:Uncharacterized protein n=1 Tax=Paralvinella palmiformis TaxID=53620 RepID=A0AAD9N2V6_9ANNE|nr:hypothetical protein LSH36_337g05070 [Paralvinella palmiformis]